MTLKDFHVTIDNELIKWVKIYCINKNNKLNPSKVINDLLEEFRKNNT